MKLWQHIGRHYFVYSLSVLVAIAVTFSFIRFFIHTDYIVSYEGSCDPHVTSCFIGCTDDSCSETYYYAKVRKYEPDVFAECGADITDCEAASICLSNDRDCSISYCDPAQETNNCEALIKEVVPTPDSL